MIPFTFWIAEAEESLKNTNFGIDFKGDDMIK